MTTALGSRINRLEKQAPADPEDPYTNLSGNALYVRVKDLLYLCSTGTASEYASAICDAFDRGETLPDDWDEPTVKRYIGVFRRIAADGD